MRSLCRPALDQSDEEDHEKDDNQDKDHEDSFGLTQGAFKRILEEAGPCSPGLESESAGLSCSFPFASVPMRQTTRMVGAQAE